MEIGNAYRNMVVISTKDMTGINKIRRIFLSVSGSFTTSAAAPATSPAAACAAALPNVLAVLAASAPIFTAPCISRSTESETFSFLSSIKSLLSVL